LLLFGKTTEVTGGEDIVMEQCASPQVAADFKRVFDDYQALIKSQGVDLMGSQPTEGNIRGGLTTINEKAMGNIQKMGRCIVQSVLPPAAEPKGPGLHFMDSSSAAAEMVKKLLLNPVASLDAAIAHSLARLPAEARAWG